MSKWSRASLFDVISVAIIGLGEIARANRLRSGTFDIGWFEGPSIEYSFSQVRSGDESASASLFPASALIGYGWFWNFSI
jgi:hypothetical protein